MATLRKDSPHQTLFSKHFCYLFRLTWKGLLLFWPRSPKLDVGPVNLLWPSLLNIVNHVLLIFWVAQEEQEHVTECKAQAFACWRSSEGNTKSWWISLEWKWCSLSTSYRNLAFSSDRNLFTCWVKKIGCTRMVFKFYTKLQSDRNGNERSMLLYYRRG